MGKKHLNLIILMCQFVRKLLENFSLDQLERKNKNCDRGGWAACVHSSNVQLTLLFIIIYYSSVTKCPLMENIMSLTITTDLELLVGIK